MAERRRKAVETAGGACVAIDCLDDITADFFRRSGSVKKFDLPCLLSMTSLPFVLPVMAESGK